MTLDQPMHFLEMTQKAKIINKKDISDFIKMKNNYASKGTAQKVKRQPVEFDKLFVTHLSDKKFVFRMQTEFLQL